MDGIYVFTVTLPEKTGVDAAKLARTVKPFKVERATTELVGDVSRDKQGRLWLTTRTAALELRLIPGRNEAELKVLESRLEEGLKTFRIAGELKTHREREEEREIDVAALTVDKVLPVEPG